MFCALLLSKFDVFDSIVVCQCIYFDFASSRKLDKYKEKEEVEEEEVAEVIEEEEAFIIFGVRKEKQQRKIQAEIQSNANSTIEKVQRFHFLIYFV